VCEVPVIFTADALLALAAPTTVAVGEPVTVIVLTTVPAHPLQFINGIGLTIESDADVVPGSFNIGAMGGATAEADGYWIAMAPSDFLWQPADALLPVYLGHGRCRWDFNVTPVGGSDQTTASGALFNVQFTFSTPGVKTFGFLEVDGASVKRTYYSDGDGNEHFWGNMSNEQAPTVTVY